MSVRQRDTVSVENQPNVVAPYHVGWHQHDCYEILYILRGSRKVYLDGASYVARGGDLVLFRPGQRHSERSATKQISFVVVRFRADALDNLPVELPDAHDLPPVKRLPQAERVVGLLRRMLDEQQHGREGSDVLLSGYLAELVILIRRAVSQPRPARPRARSSSSERVKLSIELMQDAQSKSAPLEELARHAFMSVSHFSHVFKKATGESPKRFLIRERIAKAKELLKTTDNSASEIAAALEYESPSFFYRQFKQKTGMTTSEYRSRVRRGRRSAGK